MIYWFSGTGNSRWVAGQLARRLGERLMDIADCVARGDYRHSLQPGESIGWVFPTYSWGPPPVVLDFIARWHIDGYEKGRTYCYMVATCGDDVGLTADIFASALGYIDLSAAFSVQMPNNYILLPGFDTDPAELERSKIASAPSRIDGVADVIARRGRVTDVVTGSHKWLKSRVIRPLFLRLLMSDKRFAADPSLCNSCGACVASCPMRNITLDAADGMPRWHWLHTPLPAPRHPVWQNHSLQGALLLQAAVRIAVVLIYKKNGKNGGQRAVHFYHSFYI